MPARLSEGYAAGWLPGMTPALPASKLQNAMVVRVPPGAGGGEGEGATEAVAVEDSEGVAVAVGDAVAPEERSGVGDAEAGAPTPMMNTLSTRRVEPVAPSPAMRQQKPAALLLAAGKVAQKPVVLALVWSGGERLAG